MLLCPYLCSKLRSYSTPERLLQGTLLLPVLTGTVLLVSMSMAHTRAALAHTPCL